MAPFLARLLLIFTSCLWLLSAVPVEARGCGSSMQNSMCCLAQPACNMECCRQPGDIYGTAPVSGTVSQFPAEPLAVRPHVLNCLVPTTAVPLAQSFRLSPNRIASVKIYLLHRSLLI